MAKQSYKLVTHVFKGGRFDDHTIDIDVLPELVAYKEILVETAKELWKRKNPESGRLPNNFEASIQLKVAAITTGSAEVPIFREVDVEDDALPFEHAPDEVDESARVLAQAVEAAAQGHALPGEFPKKVLPLFANYGRTLRPDESFEQRVPSNGSAATYSPDVRQRLMTLAEGTYEDMVDLCGEIRAADLDNGNFAFRTEDGTKVQGKFTPEHEALIIEGLQEHASRWVDVTGSAELSPDGEVKRLSSIRSVRLRPPGTIPYQEGAKPIWEIVEQIGSEVPETEWSKVPTDLARNLDHYLYGGPKAVETNPE